MSEKVFIMNISELNDKKLFSAAYGAVSEQRRKKADSLKQKNDRLLAVGAGLLLKYVLFNERQPYDIIWGENGKPYLASGGLFFNISHSGEYCVCAVSGSEIGCDLEKIRRANLSAAKRFFTEEEYVSLMTADTDAKKNALFFDIWTKKESRIKALGLTLKDIKPTEQTPVFYYDIAVADNYKCTVCTPKKTDVFTLCRIAPRNALVVISS